MTRAGKRSLLRALGTSYTKYTLDLDALCASQGIAIDEDVRIRFRWYSRYSYNLWLDDVRIETGDLAGPRVTGHVPTSVAATNGPLTNIVVTFNEAIETASFTDADVTLRDAQGLGIKLHTHPPG